MALGAKMLILLAISLCSAFLPSEGGGTGVPPPRFAEPVTNFTAAVGKNAHLTCKVHNLTKYKVAWFHMDRQMLLTIHKTVVTRIPRFSVTSEDNSTWTLQISDVRRDDRGQYMCQVNTEPMTSQVGYLDVVVSPEIVDSRSSGSTVIVQENGNVTLTCHAKGNPEPKISWVREDGKSISMNKRKKVDRIEGADLHLKKVSRTDMGAYLCIASNGVPPSVSKRIVLNVQFSPIVLVPNQLMSAPRGTSVTLECVTEAYPRAVTFWKFNGNMIMSTHKYSLQEEKEDYRNRVMLTIHELRDEDFGEYNCYSRNSFGENEGTVELHVLKLRKAEPHANEVKGHGEAEVLPPTVKEPPPGERENSRSHNKIILEPIDVPATKNHNQKKPHLELDQRPSKDIFNTFSNRDTAGGASAAELLRAPSHSLLCFAAALVLFALVRR